MAIRKQSPLPLNDLLRARVARVPVTQALIAANLTVFVAMLVAGAGLWHSPNGVQLGWGANFGPATQDGEWWRLGSALFLHFGAVHLAMNLWALWDGGQLVERLLGHARFIALYFAAGLCGNLLSLVVHGQQAVSGGASSAIFGVYGALLVCLWAERAALHPREFKWLFWGAVGFSAGTFGLGVAVAGIDQAAHAGGFVAGVLGGVMLRRTTTSWPWRALAAAVLAMLVTGLVLALPAPAYRWHEEQAARATIGAFLRQDAAIRDAWQDIRRGGEADASFEQLAGRVEREIARRYKDSFEQLSQLHIDPAAPSAASLDALRHYAQTQHDAALTLAGELRAQGRDRAAAPEGSRR